MTKPNPHQKKRGRKPKPHRDARGNYINGLRRRKDGRWVDVETGKTFVEKDENIAIARFRQMQSRREKRSVRMSAMHNKKHELHRRPDGQRIFKTVHLDTVIEFEEANLWPWVRNMLITRPEYAAEQTGIPELARLADLPKREPSPTLASLIKLYKDKAEAKKKQVRQTVLFWDEFCAWLSPHDIKTVKQLNTPLLAEYADHEKKVARTKREKRVRGGSLKYLSHRFNAIRRVFYFAQGRGIHPDDIRYGLDCCAVLQTPKEKTIPDPQPIPRAAFHALLSQAPNPRMRAWLLCMLNLCMYPSEALALDWDDLDLDRRSVRTQRGKTKKVRTGVLWHETVEALRAIYPPRLEQPDAPVFLSRYGTRWSVKAATNQYRNLRKLAGVHQCIKAEQCRDGAYTTSIEGGAELVNTMILAGHGVGIPDRYLFRKPRMVSEPIQSIYEAYFGDEEAWLKKTEF